MAIIGIERVAPSAPEEGFELLSARRLWLRELVDYYSEWAKKLDAEFQRDLQAKPSLYALTRNGVVVATGPNIMRLFAMIQPPDLCVIEAERLGWKIERQK